MNGIDVLVLLSGPLAVGKTSVRQALVDTHHFDYVRSSAYLKALSSQRLASEGRTGLQNLGDELDQLTDYRWLLDSVAIPAFERAPSRRRWLVDAVRKLRQVEHFRNACSNSVLHVHLTADESFLRERYGSRPSSSAELVPYQIAVQHPNEIASRELRSFADIVLDTGVLTPAQVAQQIAARIPRAQKQDDS